VTNLLFLVKDSTTAFNSVASLLLWHLHLFPCTANSFVLCAD